LNRSGGCGSGAVVREMHSHNLLLPFSYDDRSLKGFVSPVFVLQDCFYSNENKFRSNPKVRAERKEN
jgi:hypothetical protein